MAEPLPKAPQKKKREKSKTTEWEKNRRSRINEQFNQLWQALPVYDASKPLSKPEILSQAAVALRELDERLRGLLSAQGGEQKLKVSTDVIKRLEDRVKKLLLRNEQLAGLVRSAGLKIPSDFRKRVRKAPKYANALSKEQQASAIAKELEKANQQKGGKRKKARPKRPKTKKKQLNCVLLMSQPSSSCLVLAKAPNKAPQAAPQLRVLGTMMPVSPLFTQPLPTQLIVVPSKGGPRAANPAITCLPVLRPSTTQVNKVPIPAFCPKYQRKRAADLGAGAPKSVKPKRAKAAPAKAADQEPEKALEPRGRSPATVEASEASPPRPPTPPALEQREKAPKALELEMNLPQTELSNDIFASFQVPPGCQNAESTSPTAAFLLAFPLVSSGAKAAEALEEATESQAGTPNLLQIGALEMSKPAQSFADSLTPPNLFDSFAFFSGNKEPGTGFYSCALEPPPQTTAAALLAKTKGGAREPGKFPEGDQFKATDAKFNYPPSFKSCSNAQPQQLWEGDVFGESCGSYGASCKQPKGATKPSINWMATPSAAHKAADYFLPPKPRLLTANYPNAYQEADAQFPWAPPKVPQFLDGHGFATSTLPTLVGDLALNNAPVKERRKMGGDAAHPNNFLSVSQLVEPEGGAKEARRKVKAKRRPEPPKAHAKGAKQARSSSYSAEALIGVQHKPPLSSYLNENVGYFPAVQDNGYMGGNQGYQPTFQNNSFDAYIPPPPASNFGGDFLGEGGPLGFPSSSSCSNNGGYTAKKKAKKRPPPENVLPSFDMHFFPMPGAVNSPILPDDFHTTYLPPTTLYSCKTPLYSKASSEGGFMPPLAGRPQMSPSVAPQGNTLANFNLSTIFPEINKGPGQDSFGDTRAKGFQGPFI